MPRPRLSHDAAVMTGAAAVNRGRFADRKNAPKTTGKIGAAPKYFTEPMVAVWREIVKAIPAGVAGSADRMTVELAAALLAQFRLDPLDMQASRIALLMSLLSRLGLDPQARTKLQIESEDSEKRDDEWSTLTTTQNVPPSTRVVPFPGR